MGVQSKLYYIIKSKVHAGNPAECACVSRPPAASVCARVCCCCQVGTSRRSVCPIWYIVETPSDSRFFPRIAPSPRDPSVRQYNDRKPDSTLTSPSGLIVIWKTRGEETITPVSMNKSDDGSATYQNRDQNRITIPRAPQIGPMDEVDDYQKVYMLAEFIDTFDLPQTVIVEEGRYIISEGTVLLMCCRKTTKMLLTVDAYKVTHSIPCDSTSMYTVVDTVYGVEGHVYNSVNELLSCSNLPKVIYIDAKTASDLCLHDSNQLIFPYQKEQDLLGRNCLVCYDQRDTKFKLPGAKRGLFSTKPDDIKMDMTSCVKHIRGFPYSIAKYSTKDGIFPIVDSSILTLTGTSNKQSVMAKIMSGAGKDDTAIIEIPASTPIKVRFLQTNGSQANENGTSSGYQDVGKLQDHPHTTDTVTTLPGQYMTLRNSTYTTTEPLYERLTGKDNLQTFPRQSARHHGQLPTHAQNYSDGIYTTITYPGAYDDVISQPAAVAYDQPQLGPQQQLERIQKLEASNKKLHAEVAQLQACVNELVHLVVTKNPENNISQLSSMDIDTVLIMLRAMGLSEYEHIFREKEITGKKLTSLDRKKLSRYGITDVKDQEGLEDLIKGRVSPLVYLLRLPSNNTAESYAQFTKTFRKLNHYY